MCCCRAQSLIFTLSQYHYPHLFVLLCQPRRQLFTNPRVVMEILGHSQVSLTLNTYSHVIPSLGREAADRLESLLGGGDQAPRP